jgi:hypothetical protein
MAVFSRALLLAGLLGLSACSGMSQRWDWSRECQAAAGPAPMYVPLLLYDNTAFREWNARQAACFERKKAEAV